MNPPDKNTTNLRVRAQTNEQTMAPNHPPGIPAAQDPWKQALQYNIGSQGLQPSNHMGHFNSATDQALWQNYQPQAGDLAANLWGIDTRVHNKGMPRGDRMSTLVFGKRLHISAGVPASRAHLVDNTCHSRELLSYPSTSRRGPPTA